MLPIPTDEIRRDASMTAIPETDSTNTFALSPDAFKKPRRRVMAKQD